VQKMDGMTYAPQSLNVGEPVVSPGQFIFSVIGLDHGHVYAMTVGLLEAGAELSQVYDPDLDKVAAFIERFPQTTTASKEQILNDPSISLIVSAIIPSERAALGLQVLQAGKHYFCDKPGMLTLADVQSIREAVAQSGKRYFIYYGERIHVEGVIHAQRLVEEGVLGKVISMTILAPHRLNKDSRPSWFFDPAQNGGILIDIGSHQLEQFLTFTGAKSATVLQSAVANYHTSDHPDFKDYGHALLVSDTGATCFFRVDWFTPDGLGAWGDGRLFIVGTKASVEVRKYLDVARSNEGDQVYLVDNEGEHHIAAHGTIGFPFFGAMIRDCIDHTEEAIGQEHTLLAMELAIKAQEQATILTP